MHIQMGVCVIKIYPIIISKQSERNGTQEKKELIWLYIF